jgi:uracil-DNA glycosylase
MQLNSANRTDTDKEQGAVAQLGERVVRNDEVAGSIPVCSTNSLRERFPKNLPTEWQKLLQAEASEPYFQNLKEFLQTEYQSKEVYPAQENIMAALQAVDFDQVRVVILGQDPYHGEGQAIGLSFAVPNCLRPKPPSLKNIFKEIAQDLSCSINTEKSDLSGWTAQGVFLLNTVLTVRKAEAFSHRNRGWEILTDRIIQHLNSRGQPIVFLLWGAAAQKKKALITNPQHFVLEAAHPSPLSAHNGFFGCKHFSKANEALRACGQMPIDWSRTSHDN